MKIIIVPDHDHSSHDRTQKKHESVPDHSLTGCNTDSTTTVESWYANGSFSVWSVLLHSRVLISALVAALPILFLTNHNSLSEVFSLRVSANATPSSVS